MDYVFLGRHVIESHVDKITNQNVRDVLMTALPYHHQNANEIDYLYNYYLGDQPIMYRNKTVRPEINNKVLINHAQEVVRFRKGQLLAEPIQYVRSNMTDEDIGETESEDELNVASDSVTLLSRRLRALGKHAQDYELVEWLYVCGVGYRYLRSEPDDIGFNFTTVDPRDCFVVYHSGIFKQPLMAVYITKTKKDMIYTCYTDTHIYTVTEAAVGTKVNALGKIPLFEYSLNHARQGVLELVITLIDAINLGTSDRLNSVEQFVQAYIKFINCEISLEDLEKFRHLGALMIKSNAATPSQPATVETESHTLDQSQTQTLQDDLYDKLLTITAMPNRGETSSGDTGEAVSRRNGWDEAEMATRQDEQAFIRCEQKFIDAVLGILKQKDIVDLDISQVDIKFTRNPNTNILTKTQGLLNLLQAGIHPRIAVSSIGMFADPEGTWRESSDYMDKWKHMGTEQLKDTNKVIEDNLTDQLNVHNSGLRSKETGARPEGADR